MVGFCKENLSILECCFLAWDWSEEGMEKQTDAFWQRLYRGDHAADRAPRLLNYIHSRGPRG